MYSCIEHYTAAAKVNERAGFERLRVYGVLANHSHFSFYSFDPIFSTFYRDENVSVNWKRDIFFSDMIHGMHPVFVKFLKAHVAKSQLPIRFSALYYPLSLRDCMQQSKRANKRQPKKMLVALLVIIATLLIPNLS